MVCIRKRSQPKNTYLITKLTFTKINSKVKKKDFLNYTNVAAKTL